MPLSDDDKRRIEKEYEEEQYRKELERAAKAKEAAARDKYDEENPGCWRSVYNLVSTVATLAFFGWLIYLLCSGVFWGVVWLLRWLGWMAPAAT